MASDQDLLGGSNPTQPYSSMLQTRRSLSIGSNHELGEMGSSASQMSLGTDVHENVDLDETEQSLLEVKMLQKHIALFDSKIGKSERVLIKRLEEQTKTLERVEGTKLYEHDIYELDFLHNSLADFLNNLEMSLHKLGYVELEIENIRQNQSMLDFCETVLNRDSETQLCRHRLQRLTAKATKLADHLAQQPLRSLSGLKGLAMQTNWFKDSCREMLIRLHEASESMMVNEAELQQIKQSQINVEIHSDLESSLASLARASQRCKDANRVVLDMTFRYCQLYILGGCYGRVVRSQPLFEQKKSHLSYFRRSLEANRRLIEKQLRDCNQFTSAHSGHDSPHEDKKLSLIAEEDLSTDHDQIIATIRKKTEAVMSQNQRATDYLNDIEAQLELWQAQSEGQSGSFNVLESVDEEDQERPVQELILIDRSVGKLVLLHEKIDLFIEKNGRLLTKATLKIKSESLVRLCDELLNEVAEQNKQAVKLEEKIKAHHASLLKKVTALQDRGSQRDGAVSSRSFVV